MSKVLPYLILGLINFLRMTCRVREFNDSRARLRDSGNTYIYAFLHGQQAAVIMYAEPGSGAMVSRSKDGDLIAKTLEKQGCVPIRGSSGASRKGGAAALRALVSHVGDGAPASLAVDGPKGPRGVVHPGVAMLSKKTGQPVLPVAVIASRRLVFSRTWDRTQIPLPFCTIDGHFADPIFPRADESVAEMTARIQASLMGLQQQYDSEEASTFPPELLDSPQDARAA